MMVVLSLILVEHPLVRLRAAPQQRRFRILRQPVVDLMKHLVDPAGQELKIGGFHLSLDSAHHHALDEIALQNEEDDDHRRCHGH